MKFTHRATAAIAALGCFIGTALADTSTLKPLERPDPATITMPALPLAMGPKDSIDADSYFYFFKHGVSYEAAFADLDQCRLYAISGRQTTQPPTFVALGTNVITDKTDYSHLQWYFQQYGAISGVVVTIMAAIIVPIVEEDNRNATIRRCMNFKGYKRYGLSSKAYKLIDSDLPTEKTARLALLAAGPQPQTPEAGL